MENPPERPRRWRFELRTLMIAIAFMALLLVNGILWVRLRSVQAQNASMLVRLKRIETERETLTSILRELKDLVERQAQRAKVPDAHPGTPRP
jgi:type II secretory pathway component PulJ